MTRVYKGSVLLPFIEEAIKQVQIIVGAEFLVSGSWGLVPKVDLIGFENQLTNIKQACLDTELVGLDDGDTWLIKTFNKDFKE